ncbi:TetR/AcrR family transcriptional regulator [Streptomyces sp. V3I7]|uniref:TetR/AcrR family transcriptional regulator n=1 Tax=Streptomyces sp. V3I7 TaxID=3042278 RepID=UPI0027804A67|nr:TetR/AcrR family transcriptional regulator [Streptomyces sp. V3I7]MDQ0990089.1 AcrR family transcriptional regulator [Streptomyces sp. V3I7]
MTSSTTTRTTRQRAPHLGPERRRPQALDAALAIAVRDGIGAVTVGSVATEMGVTRPVVYACFSDRIEMVEALLDRETSSLLDMLVSALHSTGGIEDSELAFVSGFKALLTAAAGAPDTWRLVFAGDPDPSVAERFRAARAHLQAEATRWIAPAMEAWWHTADLKRKLPVLIELFMGACESAVHSLLDESNTWSPEDLGTFVGKAVHRAFKDA